MSKREEILKLRKEMVDGRPMSFNKIARKLEVAPSYVGAVIKDDAQKKLIEELKLKVLSRE